MPVAITPLSLKTLPITRRGLTEFSFSRFIVPWLCQFQGLAMFLDADMVATADIAEVFKSIGPMPQHSVYVNKTQAKFEWPSAMLFNCERCTALTPEYVQDNKNQLFDFAWADGVGEFPSEWNKAVGYAAPGLDAKLYHFTKGIPIWRETRGNVEDAVFHDAYKHMLHSVSHAELMSNSVHVKQRQPDKRLIEACEREVAAGGHGDW